jgi:hypothetical protein
MVNFAPVSAQSKPSVPEFTVELVDHSYVVPQTTSVDPYTGEEVIHPSYTVENKTIDITIKNQPFTSPNSSTNLYYGVRVKGNFEENWTELHYITNRTNDNRLRVQSASENTVISIPQDYPQGKVDFQVKAVIATAHPLLNTNFGHWTWEASDWSNTQTLAISESQTPTPSPTTTPLPTKYTEAGLTEVIIGAIITAAVIVAGLGLLVYLIKRK